jgi:hypothetical protein
MLLRKKTSKKINYGAIENLFSGHRGAIGHDVKQPAQRRLLHRTDRRGQDSPDSEQDAGETEDALRRAMASGLVADGLDGQEQTGDALSMTNPFYRSGLRVEGQGKARRSREGRDRPTSEDSGDESGGHDFGTALTDGATTEGEGADDGEALPWQQQKKHRYYDDYGEEIDD